MTATKCWFTERETHVAEKLAVSENFQVFCGVDGEASPYDAALARCHREMVKRDEETREVIVSTELNQIRPYVLIYALAPTIARAATGGPNNYGGQINLLFEINQSQICDRLGDPNTAVADQLVWLKEYGGRIITDLAETWGDDFLRTVDLDWALSPKQVAQGDKPHLYLWAGFLYGVEA